MSKIRLLPVPRKPDDVITQEEINKAIDDLYQHFTQISAPNKIEGKPIKVKDDEHYLTIQMPPDKDSPFDVIRRGKPFRIKTLFHSVDVETEDKFGGKISLTYEIIEAVDKITDFLRTSFPNYTKQYIEKLAEDSGISYEETKSILIKSAAKRIFDGRIAIAKFFHDEVKEILKIVIDDLLTDAQFYALSLLSGRIYATDFNKKIPKVYEERRKKRIKVISGKGRPQGKSLSQEEFDNIIQQIENAFRELESKKQRITKTAVARKIYVGHSNPVQQLNRFFKRYNFVTFEEILQDYRNQKKN